MSSCAWKEARDLRDFFGVMARSSELPLAGVRVLAVEQMAALPFATQLMARLGANVIKVERPGVGDAGRAALPAINDPDGRPVGATFLRNNLNKRSLTLNLKDPLGVEIFLRLASSFDVVCENFKAGTAERLGIGYEDVKAVNPGVIYLSVSGFGSDSPYRHRAAYASVVEAMSGIYEYKRRPGHRPTANPVGALGDISAALFAVVGVLAALRRRDRAIAAGADEAGEYVDVAMLDAAIAMTDIVTNFYSMGIPDEASADVGVVDTFAAGEGHFVLQVVREHHFNRLAEVTGNLKWLDDPRLATRRGWVKHLDDTLRPDIERWASDKSSAGVAEVLGAAGLAVGQSLTSAEVCADPHVTARQMISEMARPDGGPPVFIPGNPIKMRSIKPSSEKRVPWLGEHTESILANELGLTPSELRTLLEQGLI